MKQILFFCVGILLVCSVFAQGESTLFLEPNISYAPFGLKFTYREEGTETGFFFAARISEDYVTREVNKDKTIEFDEGDFFDINESVAQFGFYRAVTENIDVYIGFGALFGQKFYQDFYLSNDFYSSEFGTHRYTVEYTDKWIRYKGGKSYGVSPLLSYGLIFNLEDIRISIGYEIAFSSEENYPVGLINKKSFGRVEGLTFGIGYILNR